jgi:hypothetical protein
MCSTSEGVYHQFPSQPFFVSVFWRHLMLSWWVERLKMNFPHFVIENSVIPVMGDLVRTETLYLNTVFSILGVKWSVYVFTSSLDTIIFYSVQYS